MLYLTNDDAYGYSLFTVEPELSTDNSGGKEYCEFTAPNHNGLGGEAYVASFKDSNDIPCKVKIGEKIKVKLVRDDSEDKFKPFDVVLYKPTNEEGIVKRVTKDGVFVLFRIQSTAQLCKFEDLEI
jgi:hypothetical protein